MKSINVRMFAVIMLAIFLLPAIGLGTMLFGQTNVGPMSATMRLNSGGIYYGLDPDGKVPATTIGSCSMTGNATVTLTLTIVGSAVSGDVVITSDNSVDKIFARFTGGFLAEAAGGFQVIEDGSLEITSGVGKFVGISGSGGKIDILLKPFLPLVVTSAGTTIQGEIFVQIAVPITRVNT